MSRTRSGIDSGQSRSFPLRLSDQNPIVRDHVVGADHVLPGLAYPDVYYTFLVRLGLEPREWQLENIVILGALKLDGGAAVGEVCFRSRSGGELEAEVRLGGQVFSRCLIVRREHADAGGPAPDFDHLKVQARDVYHIDKCYAACQRLGLSHRGLMRTHGQVFEGRGELLVWLRLSPEQQGLAQKTLLFPAILDAAAIACFHELGIGVPPSRELFLPLAIEQVSFGVAFQEECYVLVDIDEQESGGDLKRVRRFRFYDRSGKLTCSLHGLSAKRVRELGALGAPVGPALGPLLEAASSATPGDIVLEAVARLSGLPKEQLPLHLGFFELGLSSQQLVEIMSLLERSSGHSYSPTLLFEQKNLQNLLAYLERVEPRTGDASEPRHGDASEPVAAEVLGRGELDIAIVGIDCRLPDAESLAVFRENLRVGRDSIRRVPSERWNADAYPDVYCPYGAFLRGVEEFDAALFNISPKEALQLDPNERLFLQCAYRTLLDAGYDPFDLPLKSVGVFVGVMNNHYFLRSEGADEARPLTYLSTVPNRVSFTFDLVGPSYSYDTACSSSLVAIFEAMQHLRQGRCKLALAGGVNLSLHVHKYQGLCRLKMLSPSGACNSFGEAADGYVPGEGVAALLLKPLQDALRDGDHVYAVLKGGAVNHGGRASGFTVPNPGAQTELIKAGLRDADISAQDLDFWEAHGTGTALGDPLEIMGLDGALEGTPLAEGGKLPISSLKTNIGHLEAAAGVAAVIKAALQIQHRELYPSLHAEPPNPRIDFSRSRVRVSTRLDALEKRDVASRVGITCGISSFGAGGTNCQLVLSEHRPRPSRTSAHPHGLPLAIYSEREPQLLKEYLLAHQAFLRRSEDLVLNDYCLTLLHGRPSFGLKVVAAAETREGLLAELAAGIEALDRQALTAFNRARAERLEPQLATKVVGALEQSGVASLASLRAHFAAAPFQRLALPLNPLLPRRFWPGPAPKADARSAPALFVECEVPAPSGTGSSLFCVISPNPNESIPAEHYLALELEHVLWRELSFDGLVRRARDGQTLLLDAACFQPSVGPVQPTAQLAAVVGFFQSLMRHAGSEQPVQLHVVSSRRGDRWQLDTYLRSLAHTLRLASPNLALKHVEVGDGIREYLAYLNRGQRLPEAFRNQFCVRGGQALHKSLVPLMLEGTPPASRPLRGKRVLVLGGLGGLGRAAARHLARVHGADLVLSGRRELDESGRAFVRELESYGVRAVYDRLDLGDEESVSSWAATSLAGHLPLAGVVHSAGGRGQTEFTRKSLDELLSVLAPKHVGLDRLNTALRDAVLDFYVYFSSVSTLYGDFGHGDYALGNELLNCRATDLESRPPAWQGTSVISLNWPLWRTDGIALTEQQAATFERVSGMRAIEEHEAIDVLERVLRHREHLGNRALYVVAGDSERVSRTLSLSPRVPSDGDRPQPQSDRPRPSAAPRADVLRLIHAGIAQVLGYAGDDITAERKFHDYGFDSISYAELATYLSRGLSRTIAASVFFEYPTPALLAASLASEQLALEPQVDSAPPSASEAPPPPSLGHGERIAIVGVDFVLPGARSFEELHSVLEQGTSTLCPITENGQRVFSTSGLDPKLCAHFIDGVENFDPAFFGIPQAEAEVMDPQQRLLLQCAYRALDDAGYPPSRLAQTDVGVYAASQFQDYQRAIEDVGHPTVAIGNSRAMLANRISYQFGLRGPSEVFDTACSGSFTALTHAVQDLRAGRVELALVAGVNLVLSDAPLRAGRELGVISRQNEARPFQVGADGFTKGEGLVVCILRRLSSAESAGDRIYGLIAGAYQSHGGDNATLVAPNRFAQAAAIRRSLADAGLTQAHIDYIEAQGTGGELGDPIEYHAYEDVFSEDTRPGLALGCLKGDIGHLEAASGLAALVRVLLTWRVNRLFGIRNFRGLSGALGPGKLPLLREHQPFSPRTKPTGERQPRRALIHNFGFGGVNADVVAEEYVVDRADSAPKPGPWVLPLSAHDLEALRLQVAAVQAASEDALAASPSSLARFVDVFQFRKHAHAARAALIFEDLSGLRRQLARLTQALAADSSPDTVSNLPTTPFVDATCQESPQRAQQAQRAERWLAGEQVEWLRCDSSPVPLMADVPRYRFVSRRCWVDRTGARRHSDRTIRNVSTVSSLACCRTVHASEPWLAAHRVRGVPVVPGAFHIELVLQAACQLAEATHPFDLRDVVWEAPVGVHGPEKELWALLTAAGDAHEIAIHERRDAGSTRFARATLSRGGAPSNLPRLDGVGRSGAGVDARALYENLERAGFEYGREYRIVRSVDVSAGHATAQVEGSPCLEGSYSGPNLLDAALHSCVALAGVEAELYLPFSIRRLVLWERLPSRFLVLARRHRETAAGVIAYDLELRTPAGGRLAWIDSFALRRSAADFVSYEQPSVLDAFESAAGTPRDAVERYLMKLLGTERLDVRRSYAQLGISSVYLTRIIQVLKNRYQLTLSMSQLVEMESVKQLLDSIDQLAHGTQPPEERAPVHDLERRTQSYLDFLE